VIGYAAPPRRRDAAVAIAIGLHLPSADWIPVATPPRRTAGRSASPAGVLVWLRQSTTSPGQVTGYAVTLPGHTGPEGGPRWYGGGRLAAGLTLPQLRRHWAQAPSPAPGRGAAFWFTARNGTRSTSTRPARPHKLRSTSAAAHIATRRQRPTLRGRPP
jgi:hypothetical protein